MGRELGSPQGITSGQWSRPPAGGCPHQARDLSSSRQPSSLGYTHYLREKKKKNQYNVCLHWVLSKYVFHGCFGEENIFIVPLVSFQSIV